MSVVRERVAPEPQPIALDHEDLTRSVDRSRVFAARQAGSRWRLMWLLVGPGILAMLGENDGPSMISYATSGYRYGVGFFVPFILATFAMAVICQEMAMRVGAVTHRGYGQLVRERYGRLWGWFTAGDLALTNVVTLIAEFVAIRVGLQFFGIGAGWAALLGLGLVAVTLSGGRYWRWERTVLALAAFNGLFLLAALLTHPRTSSVGHALVTFSPFPHGNTETLLLLLASTVGATVTPWMLFFQQSASVDKGLTPDDIRQGRWDTSVGAVLAATFGIGALLAGAALASRGAGAAAVADARFPGALAQVFGNGVGTLFALGLIEAGAVAVLTISASTGYAAGECLGIPQSLNSGLRAALPFYAASFGAALVAAVVILIPGVPLLSIALNANVLATVLLPVALVFLLMLASDRRLMGEWVNRRWLTALGAVVIGAIAACGAAYGIDSFLQAV